ncbi:unnamed protein product [Peronospora destructor]|uniref:RxLR effector protein n=1 Tax=Peronospora destructor TaxID=86335 RepID=A0AAV0TAR4_9STRA|nr:unnamed protein product [Peronospora destructor]
MLSESSIAQFSYTKMLIFFVVLVACSAKSVTAAASTPEEAVGSPPVLDARSAAYTSLSVQRYLRSTSDKISNSEERAGWADFQAGLMSNLQKGWTEIQSSRTAMMKWLRVKRWDIAFTSSNLHKKEPMTLFEDPEFFKFVSIVESNYPGNIDKQAKVVYPVLASHYKPDELVEIAVGMNSKNKDLAKTILGLQVKSWIGKKTEQDVFNLLELSEIKDGRGQAFSQFVSFVSKSAKSEQNPDDTLYEVLNKRFGNRLWGLLEEAMIANPESVAEQLLNKQLQEWSKNPQLDEIDIFGLLGLNKKNKADSKLFTSGQGIYWLKCVYLFEGNDDAKVLSVLEKYFKEMVPLMLSAARKEGAPGQELMKKLQEIQFGNWKNAKRGDKDVRGILTEVTDDENLIERVLDEYADFKVSRRYLLSA